MAQDAKTTVGVVGLGAMGLGMASTLASKGFRVLGFDLSEARRSLAAEAGVEPVAELRDAFAGAKFLVFSLPTAKDVNTVIVQHVGRLGDQGQGRVVVVDTSTSEPDVSRSLAAELNARGHGFLDAPVSGGPNGAAAGKLTMMIGGSEDDVTLARPVIEAMSAKAIHVGDSGAGNVAKLVNNLLGAAHLVTTGEGLKLALAAGISPEAALSVINAASGRSCMSEIHFPNFVLTESFDSGFSMGLMRKDVRLASELAARTGASLPLSDAVARLWADSAKVWKDTDDFTRMGAYLPAKGN